MGAPLFTAATMALLFVVAVYIFAGFGEKVITAKRWGLAIVLLVIWMVIGIASLWIRP